MRRLLILNSKILEMKAAQSPSDRDQQSLCFPTPNKDLSQVQRGFSQNLLHRPVYLEFQ